jgi:hypothetical protein
VLDILAPDDVYDFLELVNAGLKQKPRRARLSKLERSLAEMRIIDCKVVQLGS